MPQAAQKTVHSFCVSHKPLMFHPPLGTQILYLGSEAKLYVGQNPEYASSHISDFYADLDAHHNFLTGCSGTFAIARLFESGQIPYSNEDSIYISQYRKFMLLDALGKPAIGYPAMQLVLPSELNGIGDIIVDNISRCPQGFMLTKPMELQNLFYHYAVGHKPADLLRYVAIALNTGILQPAELLDFLNRPIIIPGGAQFGLYPIDVFLSISKQLEAISLEFLRLHAPSDLSVYQRRAVSFCNERMGSYLLEKQIRQNFNGELPNEFFGFMHTIIDNEATTMYTTFR